MLTKLTIRNFKRFDDVEIELGKTVVFIGPNDSGKTTALQALALWDVGLRRWNEKRKGKTAPEKRPGVTINRKDLISIPIPEANLLWHDLHVQTIQKKIHIEVIVEGTTSEKPWTSGLEFSYANEESFYCRPLRLSEEKNPERMEIPEECTGIQVAFLPPMSGLAANEIILNPGTINVRIGEGRTAEVLRNLCYQVLNEGNGRERWAKICSMIKSLFRVDLDEPIFIAERGEIQMAYRDRGIRLDLSSSGRGFQQTLLLLAHLSANPRSVLLLDEPDAHLEILRQRQIYQLLTDFAFEQDSQIIAASHSEVLLNEAAHRDMVVAFVGEPHRIDDRGSQVLKSLKEIGFDHFYQAEETGWVLYLEGSTDLAILRAFADILGHPGKTCLERPFVHYVMNLPDKARDHFYGLREAKNDLFGFCLFDRLEKRLQDAPELTELMWKRREIENYLMSPETLLAYAKDYGRKTALGPIFELSEQERWVQAMQECIDDFVPRAALKDRSSNWWMNTKATDDFLDPLMEKFHQKLGLQTNLMRKTDYHVLARYVPRELIDPEVSEVLDRIVDTAGKARPVK